MCFQVIIQGKSKGVKCLERLSGTELQVFFFPSSSCSSGHIICSTDNCMTVQMSIIKWTASAYVYHARANKGHQLLYIPLCMCGLGDYFN